METPEPDRLTRALTMLEQQQALLATVRGLAERQALQLSAIELDRGNGHP